MNRLEEPSEPVPDLGAKEKTFRGEASVLRGLVGLILAGLGAVLLVTAFTYRASAQDEGMYGFLVSIGLERVASAHGRRVASAIGLCLLCSAWVMVRSIPKLLRTTLEIHQQGLVLRVGQEISWCRWTDIETIIERRKTTMRDVFLQTDLMHFFLLRLRSGEQIVLKSYLEDLSKIGDLIRQKTVALLLPKYQADLSRFGAEFGPVVLRRDGIEVKQKVLPWQEVGRVKVDQDEVNFYRRRGWFAWQTVNLEQIPNLHVLTALVDQMRAA